VDYYELRTMISKFIPRMTTLAPIKGKADMVKEKGRKTNYKEFKLTEGKFVDKRRLLNVEEVSSFVEISLRAAACPMPFNIDIWDGITCPFNCLYCFANSFRASLYTSFFDNSRSMGLRHCNPDYYKRELDKMMKLRGTDPHSVQGDIQKAVAMEIPIRMGIRFEDFLPIERKKHVSLEMMRYLACQDYPLMINTKSDLLQEEEYLEALSSNKAKTAVHITMISNDPEFRKKIEPGAPSFERRLKMAKALSDAGVRVVARIEPYLVFLTDDPAALMDYMDKCWEAGIRHITFDTYSYSAKNPGIRKAFMKAEYDFDRLFLLGCGSQGLGSFLLDKYMDLFRDYGFKCSTFDLGCVPNNHQMICCEVGDWFEGSGWNYGSAVSAVWYIQRHHPGDAISWCDFEAYVNKCGGFLSEKLKCQVKRLWNLEGNASYFINWARGIEPVGRDQDGIVWVWNSNSDFREELWKNLG
jgi:DNA repair photolyase